MRSLTATVVAMLTPLLLAGQPALAEPPASSPTPGLRQRLVAGVRGLSLRAANGCRNLRERVSPTLRHGAMTLLSAGVTYASLEGLASRGDIASPVGVLGLAGVVLGLSSTLHQGTKTLKAALPTAMGRVGQRLRRTPLVGPWLKDSRPWLQRLRGRFRGKSGGEP